MEDAAELFQRLFTLSGIAARTSMSSFMGCCMAVIRKPASGFILILVVLWWVEEVSAQGPDLKSTQPTLWTHELLLKALSVLIFDLVVSIQGI